MNSPPRIILEDRLRPVAVMHVPVDDQHALSVPLLLSVARRHGHVIHVAEALGLGAERVVPGRPDSGEAVAEAAFAHRVDHVKE